MSSVLVTGGAGFIGHSVVKALRSAGARVTVADRHRPEHAGEDPGVDVLVGDLRDEGFRRRAVDGVDGVVHLAALTSVLESVRHPAETYATNVDATAALIEAARESGVERFVFASTNAVTGDVGEAEISECLPLSPMTPYGATKAAAEMILSAYRHAYGIRAASLRLTNVYGPGMAHKDSFVPRLMRAALSGATVDVYGDGGQRRDLVSVGDVARAMLRALDEGWVGPVIVGSGRSVSVLELVEAVRAVTGRPLPVRHVPAKQGEMRAVIVQTDRAQRLGWQPEVDLRDGLAEVWDEFRAAVRSPG